MGISDMIIAAVILGGAGWLLYHSLWKKKGHCHGCSSGCCDTGKKYKVEAEEPMYHQGHDHH